MSETLVDGHVHFHECFTLRSFLESATANLAPHMETDSAGVLLLAQIGSDQPLDGIIQQTEKLSHDWSVTTPDTSSIVFTRADIPPIVCLAGRQIVTQEKLELLSICSNVPIDDGQSLEKSIQQILADEGIPVLPWGFGKWWFSRGAKLNAVLRESSSTDFLLGDNGCRPRIWRPRLLRRSEADGFCVLAGSDPLPIPSHVRRVGSFGNVFSDEIDVNAPTAWMRERLQALSTSPKTFGRCRSMREFVGDQLQLRLNK